MKTYWATTSSGRIELTMTERQVNLVSRTGDVYSDAAWLVRTELREQLTRLDPATVRAELKQYGAWDEQDLADHKENLIRLVWVLAGDLAESLHRYNPVKRGQCVECGLNKRDGYHTATI